MYQNLSRRSIGATTALKQNYDIVIAGGGPAGSMAALEASKAGLRVCLLDKVSRIGNKVRCGEAMSQKALEYFFKVNPKWVSKEIRYCKINSPSGIQLKTEFKDDTCLILDRKRFDYDLSIMAQNKGCEIFTNCLAKDLIIKNNYVKGLVVEKDNREYRINSKLVIAADGIESRLGRKAGLRTQVKMKDMASGIEYLVDDIDIDPNALDMYVGSEIAPGGYLWIFPKGEKSANIGVAITGKHSGNRSAEKYLDDFISKKFPNSTIRRKLTGGIPVTKPIENPIKNGLVLVGDAARHINPLTGGGIAPAMKAGMYIGRMSAEIIDDPSEKRLSSYVKLIEQDFMKKHRVLYNIKEVISKLSDIDFNNIAQSVSKTPQEKLTLAKIFKSAVYRKPSLVFDAVRVLAGY